MALKKCIKTYLRCYTSYKPKGWFQWLTLVEWSYSNNYHSTTKHTPFEALYGYVPPKLLSYILRTTANDLLDQYLRIKEQINQALRENLEMAQHHMKIYVNKNRKERTFEERDMVYLKLQLY